MYRDFYGLKERPFSITPDPRYVYLSQQHQDALAHLLYGIGRGGSGGFVQLTGEVGTGKTTICRLLLEQIPENTRIALILNPMLEPVELLQAICDELVIDTEGAGDSIQQLNHRLNRYLLDAHAAGERVVLLIDEAQNMSPEALEQVRLLTNLETATDKLLQIILLGQPELRDMLDQPELRQLAQRITARYHLAPLTADETGAYVHHRLAVAGAARCPFTKASLKQIYAASGGVPRLINIIADRAMMAGYARELDVIPPALVSAAAREVISGHYERRQSWARAALAAVAVVAVISGGGMMAWFLSQPGVAEPMLEPGWIDLLAEARPEQAFAESALFWQGATAGRLRQACEAGVGSGFACETKRGSWALIERIGRPVILKLNEPSGGRLLLVAMDETDIYLQNAGARVAMPRHEADARWLGEFMVIWPDDGAVYRAGDEGEGVARMKMLAAADRDVPWEGDMGGVFGDAFRDWVIRYQRHHGLLEDGIIGPSTRFYLEVPQLDGPRLATVNN